MNRALIVASIVALVAGTWWYAVAGARPASELDDALAKLEVLQGSNTTLNAHIAELEQSIDLTAECGDLETANAELQGIIRHLRDQLADAERRAADAESLDLMAWLLYSDKPFAWKAGKILAIEDERERGMAAWKLGGALAQDPGAGAMLLAALRDETDPDVIGILAQVLRAGALGKSPPEIRRGFVELLRTGELPAVRAAAAQAVFMNQGFRGRTDAATKELAEEMNGELVKAVGTEQSPEVIGAIARAMAAWTPTPEAVEAFREAARRMPASKGRRETWRAIARGTFMRDRATLMQDFRDARDAEERTDIAAGIARAGNSMSGMMGGDAETQRKRREAGRADVRALFEGADDLVVRREILRGAFHGLGALSGFSMTDEDRADRGRFIRELAALEPDADQRDRIEALAEAIETGAYRGSPTFSEIMYPAD